MPNDNGLASPAEIPQVDQSRCLRMRLSGFSCTECIDICSPEAIQINDKGIGVKRDSCSGCMLCTSSCPSNSFVIDSQNFYKTIDILKNARAPVLGCSLREGVQAHAKIPCLGVVSEEHLVALMSLIDDEVQINLTNCGGCANRAVVAVLKDRLSKARRKIPTHISEKIKLIEDEADLHFKQISYTRRGFFGAVKSHTAQAVIMLLKNDDQNAAQAYSDKSLPFRRKLLNSTIVSVAEEEKKAIATNYYYSAHFDERCNRCDSCVAMCPTAALRVDGNGSEDRLVFDTFRCSGCGLCESFCIENAVRIKRGGTLG